MSRLLASFLLASLLLPAGCGWLWLRLEQEQARQAALHHLAEVREREGLVLLVFSHQQVDHQLEWEHSREFEWRGQKYDVAERRDTCDSVFLWCWPDVRETALVHRMAILLAGAQGATGDRGAGEEQLLLLLKSLFFPPVSASVNGYLCVKEPVMAGSFGAAAVAGAETVAVPPPRMKG